MIQENLNNRKRRRHENPHQFLDLEATVDQDESDEDIDELDDFIDNNDTEPIVGDLSSSHHRLYLEHDRVNGEEWDELLALARHNNSSGTANANFATTTFDASTDENLALSVPNLWRVAVKAGYEETATFLLMEKLIRNSKTSPKVYSIFGRTSRPGWIVVEAATQKDAQVLCCDVSYICSLQTYSMNSQDAAWYLKQSQKFIPKSNSWIRLTARPYKGDLAFVESYTDAGAEVFVVPRMDLRPLSLPKKRQRTENFKVKPIRPEPCLFDEATVRKIWPKCTISSSGENTFTFQSRLYMDGFLFLVTHDFQSGEATPVSSAELSVFEKLSIVPRSSFERALEAVGTLSINIGDSVKVVNEELQGSTGKVVNVLAGEAIVHVNCQDVHVSIPLNCLRKNFAIGDEVIVLIGQHEGSTGWIVAINDDSLSIFERQFAREITVPLLSVSFYHPPIISRSREQEIAAFAETKFIHFDDVDASRQFVGLHVRIIHDSRKNYRGIIKSTQRDGFVLVEVQPTLREERYHLSHLANFNDPHLQPLCLLSNVRQEEGNPAEDGHQVALLPPPFPDIQLSLMPLIASTPLPPSTSVNFSPAWNPSSRSPNLYSTDFPSNPWMALAGLSGKRAKILIKNTKPFFQDPDWKHGDYEGRAGLWIGTVGGSAKIRIGMSVLEVPPQYVRPVYPSTKGQNVVVLEGSVAGMQGRVMRLNTASNTCSIKPQSPETGMLDAYDIPVNHLIVVAT